MVVLVRDVNALRKNYPGLVVHNTKKVRADGTKPGMLDSFMMFFGFAKPPASTAVLDTASVLTFDVDGIVGAGLHRRQRYNVIFEASHLEADLPRVWVLAPACAEIRHVNIFRVGTNHRCGFLNADLPSFCWGSYTDRWRAAPGSQRTLPCLLELITQFLNEENPGSPARST